MAESVNSFSLSSASKLEEFQDKPTYAEINITLLAISNYDKLMGLFQHEWADKEAHNTMKHHLLRQKKTCGKYSEYIEYFDNSCTVGKVKLNDCFFVGILYWGEGYKVAMHELQDYYMKFTEKSYKYRTHVYFLRLLKFSKLILQKKKTEHLEDISQT